MIGIVWYDHTIPIYKFCEYCFRIGRNNCNIIKAFVIEV